MRKEALFTALLILSGSSLAQEGARTLKLSQPLELYGGVSAGVFYTTNEGNNSSQARVQLTNAIVGLTGEVGKGIKMGFDLAVGTSLWATVLDGGQGTPSSQSVDSNGDTDGFGILWGYATIKPHPIVAVDVGVLTTNIGYEVADTYSNPNVTFGAVWNAQPFIYPGIRLTLSPLKDIDFYAEYNQELGLDNFALGVLGEKAGISFALTYYDYRASKNLIDIVLGYSIANIDLGLNADYQWLDNPAPGQDSSAFGVALYATPNLGSLSIPARLEYFYGGTSGIYQGGKGFTLTVTPTFRPTENTYVRGEVAYILTDNNIFRNGTENNKTTLSVELGFTF